MIQDKDVELKKLDFECKRPQIVETGAGPCVTKLRACIVVPPSRPDDTGWDEVDAEPFEASLLAPSSMVKNEPPGEHECGDQTGSRASCQARVMQTPGRVQMC